MRVSRLEGGLLIGVYLVYLRVLLRTESGSELPSVRLPWSHNSKLEQMCRRRPLPLRTDSGRFACPVQPSRGLMRIVVPKETAPGERRVALVPESCKKLIQAGYEIAIEAGAGEAAGFADAAYREVGARSRPIRRRCSARPISCSRSTRPHRRPPAATRSAGCGPGAIYLGSLMPLRNLDVVQALAERKVTAFSTDAIPRTTRAQAMDTLSSMANIAGYKGVLLAAVELQPLLPDADDGGRHGVARPRCSSSAPAWPGCRPSPPRARLGANVFATDVRPEVKEQIESVGAKYVGIELKQSAAAGGGYAKELSEEDQPRQQQLLGRAVRRSRTS